MALLNSFDISANIWKINKPLRYLFEDIKGMKFDEKSSKEFWALAMLYHSDSPYSEISTKDALVAVRSYLKDNKWDPLKSKMREAFMRSVLTTAERSLLVQKQKIEERDAFLSNTPYSVDTCDFLEKILVNTKKVQDAYADALRRVLNEKEESTRGAVQESAGELNLI